MQAHWELPASKKKTGASANEGDVFEGRKSGGGEDGAVPIVE
jgi:hypothetical protein